MSSWYIFSAMGFYPVNPVSGEYVVGSYVIFNVSLPLLIHGYVLLHNRPFFDKITIDLPSTLQQEDGRKKTLTITARGAPTKPYIKSLTVNGRQVDTPFIQHADIANGGDIVFEMSDQVESWGNTILVSCCLVVMIQY